MPNSANLLTKDLINDMKTYDRSVSLLKMLEDSMSVNYIHDSNRMLTLYSAMRADFPTVCRTLFVFDNAPRLVASTDDIHKLITIIKSIEVMDMTLAFYPTEDFITKVSSWLENNLSQQPLVRFHLDRSLFGGFRIAFKGKYYDYSLETLCTDFFNKEKDAILSVLQK